MVYQDQTVANPSALRVSFADVPLLIPAGKDWPAIQDFVDRYIPLRELFTFPMTPGGGWIGYPQDQWPLSALELNTLYWPTGCARWGYGAFLFSGDVLSDILDAIKPDGSATTGRGNLEMGDPDDEDHYLKVAMYGLRPIPISACPKDEDGKAHPLYILPLVCPRYLHQNQRVYNSEEDEGTPPIPSSGNTGSRLGHALHAKGFLGETLWTEHEYETLEADVFQDPMGYVDEFAITQSAPAQFYNGPQLAESICWSQGVCFVPELDAKNATYQDKEAAGTPWDDLVSKINDDTFIVVCGHIVGLKNRDENDDVGFASCGVPAKITFLYPGVSGALSKYGDYVNSNVATVQASDVSNLTGVGTCDWTIATPIVFYAKCQGETSTESKAYKTFQDDLKEMTETVAGFWYAMAEHYADVTMAGICNLPQTAFIDVIEWTMNARGPMTRARSRRPNAFPSRLVLQHKPDLKQDDGTTIAQTFAGDYNDTNDSTEMRSHGCTSGPGHNDTDGGFLKVHHDISDSGVTPGANELGSVTFNGCTYDAVYPVRTRGYDTYAPEDTTQSDKQTAGLIKGVSYTTDKIIAAWDSKSERFFILNQRPLDFDIIYDEVAARLVANGQLNGGIGNKAPP